ncbi:hypothetical protein [Streptomyces sp. NPDC001889]
MTNPMTVTRNADGSHSPLYDENWPQATQLEWHAGIIALDTGLRITVTDQENDLYSISVRGTTGLSGQGPMDFHTAWAVLDGVRIGAWEARR